VTPPINPEVAARRELATPFRYHLQSARAPSEPWWDRLIDAIVRWWQSLFAHVRGGGQLWPLLGDVVIVLFVALLLYASVRAGRRTWGGDVRRQAWQTESLVAERREHGLAREAYLAAERGDFLSAVRLILRAAVTMLDLRGALHDDASATVWELRRQAQTKGDVVAAPFGEIASAYTSAVYAQRPIEALLWTRAAHAYEKLHERSR
jgi:hypothetical protein